MKQAGFFDLPDHLQRLSEAGDPFETVARIVDATLVSAPRQRNPGEEKARIKTGERATDIWPGDPAKAAQKDTSARWTVKQGKIRKQGQGGVGHIPIAIPVFGYNTPHRRVMPKKSK